MLFCQGETYWLKNKILPPWALLFLPNQPGVDTDILLFKHSSYSLSFHSWTYRSNGRKVWKLNFKCFAPYRTRAHRDRHYWSHDFGKMRCLCVHKPIRTELAPGRSTSVCMQIFGEVVHLCVLRFYGWKLQIRNRWDLFDHSLTVRSSQSRMPIWNGELFDLLVFVSYFSDFEV